MQFTVEESSNAAAAEATAPPAPPAPEAVAALNSDAVRIAADGGGGNGEANAAAAAASAGDRFVDGRVCAVCETGPVYTVLRLTDHSFHTHTNRNADASGSGGQVVTPWEVEGDQEIDYDKLVKTFGSMRITEVGQPVERLSVRTVWVWTARPPTTNNTKQTQKNRTWSPAWSASQGASATASCAGGSSSRTATSASSWTCMRRWVGWWDGGLCRLGW